MTRHRWDVTGDAARFTRTRVCIRCGMVGRTFGSGGWRVWSYRAADGKLLGDKAGDCPGEKPPAETADVISS